MPTPPELRQQFSTAAERAAAQAELLQLGTFVREVIAAANGAAPAPVWLTAELQKPMHGYREAPAERLARYYNLFGDELRVIDDIMASASENRLDDDSLRTARYLARRLLANLLDCPPPAKFPIGCPSMTLASWVLTGRSVTDVQQTQSTCHHHIPLPPSTSG